MSGPIRVSIALIGRGGEFLIRRRPHLPGSPMPGLWEFPGGKCEENESPEQALVRECLEETGLMVRIRELRRRIEHLYPHGHVELHYFDCETEEPTAQPRPESGFRWVDAAALPELPFPEANEPILLELAEEDRPPW
ncbi:MAG: ADP-ribose pyrophosphatase [Planctomycetota bacterium]|nr:ADP-ribose pyrophosphatase [Planctomycetota bacterium]